MATDDATAAAEIAELRDHLGHLEARVAWLEQAQGLPAVHPSGAHAAAMPRANPPDATAATLFRQVALLTFALLGALILRVLTQQGILGQTLGTLLGFLYAGGLLFVARVPGPLQALARATSLLQGSGVVLAFAIALESALRTHTLSRPFVMGIIISFGLLGVVVGDGQRKVALIAASALGAMLGLVALGLEAEGLPVQLTGLVGFAALTAALSWRRGFGVLRPLVLPAAMLLLAIGFPLARQQGLAPGALLVAMVACVAGLAIQHVAMRARLRWDAAWLPVAIFWLAALARVTGWPARNVAVATAAIFATALLALLRRSCAASPALAGLAATAALAGAVGWPAVDARGVLGAVAGLALWQASGRSRAAWAALPVALLLLVAAGTGLAPLVRGLATWPNLVAGALLALTLLVHYQCTGRAGADRMRADAAAQVAPAILLGGLCVALAVGRTLLHRLIPDPASFLLAQTGLLAGSAMALAYWGHMGNRRPVVYSALACMGAAILKVALFDLVRLKDVRLLAAVILLGLASVVISLILRRKV